MRQNIEFEAAVKAIKVAKNLSKDLSIPASLKQLGVTKGGIPRMSWDAFKSRMHLSMPEKIDLEGIKALYEIASE